MPASSPRAPRRDRARVLVAALVAVVALALTASFAVADGPLALLSKAAKPAHTDAKARKSAIGKASRVRLAHRQRTPKPTATPAPTPPADTTAPDTSISGGPSGTTTATGASFGLGSTESGSSFECKLDDAGWSSCGTPKSYGDLTVGAHQLAARAKDGAGNVDASPATRSWTVAAVPAPPPPADTSAPDTSISGGPIAELTATSAGFNLSSSEAGSTFECKLDSGSWAACTSPKSYSGLTLGLHQFLARARDGAGNVDPTPAAWIWTVIPILPPPPGDTTAPETSIGSGPSGATTATGASFGFSASESGSTFACKLDSGSWAACTSPKSYSGLALGAHQFSVRATDAAGNVDASPATRSWTVEAEAPPPPPVDTTAPDTSISGGPSGTTTATGASFGLGSTESGSSFECKLDGAGWSSCASPKSYSGLAVGAHQFSARAADAAGNVDSSPATRSWTVEAEAPPPPAEGCTTTVSSVSAAQSSVSSASPGTTVCLANGSYGKVTLNATKASPGVTLRAANPAGATIAGASIQGSNLTLSRFVSTSSIQIQPGANGITVEHNRVTGGGQGIDAGPTSTTTINDTRIIGNELIGPFGEDAIHLNRYHDANGDGVGILIEGNEITNVRENGNHSDCLQTVWVGDHIVFRKNYLHDNRCQGFFVKDQASLGGVSGPIAGITVDDNLFVRNKEPCAPEAPGCGQPMYFQVFGPYSRLQDDPQHDLGRRRRLDCRLPREHRLRLGDRRQRRSTGSGPTPT